MDVINIYGDINTKTFFLEQLIDENNIKDNNEEDVEEELKDFEHTSKVKLEDIISELPNIVHKEFDYYDYSEKDNSNNRFMIKQKNTNKLKDDIFSGENENDENEENSNDNKLDLFDNEVPF